MKDRNDGGKRERPRKETGGDGDRKAHPVSPLHADEQDAPEPERPTRPDEEAGQSIGELEEPPQAEGPRD